jgi:phosphatidylserine decarboxylase
MHSGFLAAWREVKAIILGLSGITLLLLTLRKWWAGGLVALLLAWVVYFFRDPERRPASSSPDVILAPADGRMIAIELDDEPYYLRQTAQRLTIFLGLFDVHVQRSPCHAVVTYLRYQPGDFAPAFLKRADDNEANLVGLHSHHGPLVVKQIAGVLARRISCWLYPGDEVAAGERLGLIKFGSRVDLFLPPEKVEILVKAGQQVYAGQTVVACWKEPPAPPTTLHSR